ncbi:MAG TPA: exodeoxyribonuclease VII large subunit [Firmicutes bacterium]|nr:exodeoxyribonuclease VII large subunit [Candidatus Fermentithermobacillaceae bacterium]
MLDPGRALTVSQLNAYVKKVLWQDELLRQVLVRGEIANLRDYQGHLYFTLKDEKCSVKAVMWRSDASRLSFVPEEGMQVIVAGSVSVFERDGVYQVYATYMEPSGLGALYAALEKLKEKLEKEGLFAAERKRPLPLFPRKIGVVTSLRGAAIKDIISVGRRRYPGVQFVVADTKVQGEGAPQEIARGIAILNKVPGVDVIIVGRGGGSQEDLFVFNDEIVARAIYASRVPVVSAVGHERDVTVADLVADVRAPTPSAAAEMVVPLASGLKADVEVLVRRATDRLRSMLEDFRKRLLDLRSRPSLERPDWYLLTAKESLLRLRKDLEDDIKSIIEKEKLRFGSCVAKMDALSPLKILSRGYAVARRIPDLVVIRGHEEAPPGTRVNLTLHKGSLLCLVEESVPPEEVGRE